MLRRPLAWCLQRSPSHLTAVAASAGSFSALSSSSTSSSSSSLSQPPSSLKALKEENEKRLLHEFNQSLEVDQAASASSSESVLSGALDSWSEYEALVDSALDKVNTNIINLSYLFDTISRTPTLTHPDAPAIKSDLLEKVASKIGTKSLKLRQYETLVDSYAERNDLGKLAAVFQELSVGGLTPSAKMVNTLLAIYLQNREYGAALTLFVQMQMKSKQQGNLHLRLPTPTANTYHIIIAALFAIPMEALQPHMSQLSGGKNGSNAKDRYELAETLFAEMKHTAGLTPNLPTWLFMMQLHQRNKKYRKMIYTWIELASLLPLLPRLSWHNWNLKVCFDLALYALLRTGCWWDAVLLFRKAAQIDAPEGTRFESEKVKYHELLATTFPGGVTLHHIARMSLSTLVRGLASNANHLRELGLTDRAETCLNAMTAIVAEVLPVMRSHQMSLSSSSSVISASVDAVVLPIVVAALCRVGSMDRTKEAVTWFRQLTSPSCELQSLVVVSLSRHADLINTAWDLYIDMPPQKRSIEASIAMLDGLIHSNLQDSLFVLLAEFNDKQDLARIVSQADPSGTIVPLLNLFCTSESTSNTILLAERILLLSMGDLRWNTPLVLHAVSLVARAHAVNDISKPGPPLDVPVSVISLIERIASCRLSGPAGPQMQLMCLQTVCESCVSVIATTSSSSVTSPAYAITSFLDRAYQTPQLNASLTPILSVDMLLAVCKTWMQSESRGRSEVTKLRDEMEALEMRLGRKGILAQAVGSVLDGDVRLDDETLPLVSVLSTPAVV